ncbi:hypothetical protein IGK30_003234 [Enterococcus sp. AZ178]|uniref:acylaminoacyl-peptidase n=1 Tax=Enterococcus sp. AZ178 TaxID=2774822 RepID=UPI003F2079F9
MRAERIEQILSKHGVADSKELSLALEEILKVFSKDRELAKNIKKENDLQDRLMRKIQGRG